MMNESARFVAVWGVCLLMAALLGAWSGERRLKTPFLLGWAFVFLAWIFHLGRQAHRFGPLLGEPEAAANLWGEMSPPERLVALALVSGALMALAGAAWRRWRGPGRHSSFLGEAFCGARPSRAQAAAVIAALALWEGAGLWLRQASFIQWEANPISFYHDLKERELIARREGGEPAEPYVLARAAASFPTGPALKTRDGRHYDSGGREVSERVARDPKFGLSARYLRVKNVGEALCSGMLSAHSALGWKSQGALGEQSDHAWFYRVEISSPSAPWSEASVFLPNSSAIDPSALCEGASALAQPLDLILVFSPPQPASERARQQ